MTWGAIGAAAVGVAGSALMAPDGSQTSTASKEPWEDAAPWIRDNIAQGQQLQQYYTQNPFNSIQQQGMQGLLSGYEHQNNQVIPGLLGFANNLMGQNYQRGAPVQQPGLMSSQPPQGQSMGGAAGQMPIQGGQSMMQKPEPTPQGMYQPMQGGFTPPPTQGSGPVNWNAMNPLYKDPAAAPPPPAPIPEGELFRRQMADALFPESENKFKFGIGGPSLSELELRRMLGRPSNFVDVSG